MVGTNDGSMVEQMTVAVETGLDDSVAAGSPISAA